MPITAQININLATLSQEKKVGAIVKFVEESLKSGLFTPLEMLDYAAKYQWSNKPGKPYVIEPAIINKIGLVVNKLVDQTHAACSTQFYKLAAERDDIWGHRNYAQILLNQSNNKEALSYIQKAIELAAKENKNPDELKDVLHQALRANQQYHKANIALIEYFKYHSTKKDNKEILETLESIKRIVLEFQRDIAESLKKPTAKEWWLAKLEEITPFINIKIPPDFKVHLNLTTEVYFITAKCHEELGNLPQAMNFYCAINDNSLPFYKEAIAGRARILKSQIAKSLSLKEIEKTFTGSLETKIESSQDAKHVDIAGPMTQNPAPECQSGKDQKASNSSANNQASGTAGDSKSVPNINPAYSQDIPKGNKSKKKEEVFELPGGVPFTTKFVSNWKEETRSYHSVNIKGIAEEAEKRKNQLKQVITSKQTEIALVEEAITNSTEIKNDHPLVLKKKALEQELGHIESIQVNLGKVHEEYSFSYRQTYRRYAVETNFFNPRRSKKAAEIVTLANEIIDQRFKLDTAGKPVNLTNRSTRLFISAERAFQEAVIALTGDSHPNLGIPILRQQPWAFEDGASGATHFGPIEKYQIGNTVVTSEHRTDPKRNRLGDSYLPQHGKYSGDILPFLRKIAGGNNKNEQRIATFMIQYGKYHQPISHKELQDIYTEAIEADVDHFNSICFLIMAKEQGQWHSARSKSHQLGMSIAQARCLIMLEAGFITLRDAFSNDAVFGVYSQTNIVNQPNKVAESCKRIDELYMAYLQTKYPQAHLQSLKRHIDTGDLVPTYLPTREQAREDLLYVHGGDNDTDDEGYDSELDMQPKLKI